MGLEDDGDDGGNSCGRKSMGVGFAVVGWSVPGLAGCPAFEFTLKLWYGHGEFDVGRPVGGSI